MIGQQEQHDKLPDDGFPLIPAPADGISVSTTGRGLYIPDWLSQVGAEQSSPDNNRNSSMFAKPSDIHTDLLSTYFEHIHPYLPIIHRPTFQKQLQENKICELLLYAMYAVASRWQQHQQQQQQVSHMQQQQQNPAGWTYYESAFKLLDNCADAPRLSTVQALILMIKYHEHVRRPGFFWRTRFYFQLIVRMCQDLQLYRLHHQHRHHRSNSSNSSITSNGSSNGDQLHAADTEQRSRLFWAVYAYDVLTSTEQGTVANFTKASVDFPQLLPEEDGTERDVITYFHWTAKIAHIHGKILTFLRSKYGQGAEDPSSDSGGGGGNGNSEDNNSTNGVAIRTLTTAQEQKQRDNLVSNIDELGKAMSAAIRQPPSADDKSSSAKQYPYYASRFLYMSFHFTAILLHRPYGEASAYHREQCFIAALAITQIASELIQTGGVECLYYCPRGVQQVIHYLAASITIHRLLTSPSVLASTATATRSIQKDSATTEKRAREACDKSLDIIHQLIKVSPAVEIYTDRREPVTPPSPSPTPMEEVPISPPDRSAKARRVSKEFSGIRQNSSGGLPTSKLNSGSNNATIMNNTHSNAAGMAMPPPPQPQQQQNTAMNNTPAVNPATLVQQQHSPYPQSHRQHPNPHRLSAPTTMMMDYASSMYLQQTPQPSPATPYSIQQQQAQYGIPNFSQAAAVSMATNFYPQSIIQQHQQQQPFITSQQQVNHHTQAQHQQQQQSNMYNQHLHQHQHHHHHHHQQPQQLQHHSHRQHQHQHIHHQQQHPSTRRHTVSGDMNAMSNFMVYPGITTTPSLASVNSHDLIDGTCSGVTAAISAAAIMNPWPTSTFTDQDLQMDPYIQPSVAQSMMGLLMDQDENSMFAATAAAPAPP
ncbi:fungal-specific transcription factor domain-containing protein [Zychaea mexicana]|uniref:fungal-specific transcription factor domain-containing protein n=1 Tax=Zychaea mexicana TaxID=64656 RepID=UPI0022FF0678|nr:fungal-specific transcription factor domain-containing protein [Zychaea mexicana]KAI9488537.1 fungal-specific transcription factor domain-containing protein [Zychaea mexicana]